MSCPLLEVGEGDVESRPELKTGSEEAADSSKSSDIADNVDSEVVELRFGHWIGRLTPDFARFLARS